MSTPPTEETIRHMMKEHIAQCHQRHQEADQKVDHAIKTYNFNNIKDLMTDAMKKKKQTSPKSHMNKEIQLRRELFAAD